MSALFSLLVSAADVDHLPALATVTGARRRVVGTYQEQECTMVEKSCTVVQNCAGDVTCTGPDDSTCSACESGFSGDTCEPNPPTPTPPPANPQYQKLDYGDPSCASEVEITTQDECRQALESLGVTGFEVWTDNKTTMPRFCSIQVNTDTMIWNAVPAGQARHDLAPVCKTTPGTPAPPPGNAPAPPPGNAPQYQALNYRWPGCPEEFEITTQEECRQAITSLGFPDSTTWTGSAAGMPRFCSIQKDTNSMIWNDVAEGDGRWDLRPVCKWTGTPTPPEPTPAPVPLTRNTLTVADEEWNYFLAFQESRRVGFSCPCGELDWISCNGIGGEGKHFHEPNPEKVTFDCTLWIAAYRHAEDQAITNYCSHTGRDGRSPRMRAEDVGANGGAEHQACRHSTGVGALTGLQTSPGHCNSMYNPDFKGFAVGHGYTFRDIWTVMYNGGGDDISDSTSCIPAGYTATGELI